MVWLLFWKLLSVEIFYYTGNRMPKFVISVFIIAYYLHLQEYIWSLLVEMCSVWFGTSKYIWYSWWLGFNMNSRYRQEVVNRRKQGPFWYILNFFFFYIYIYNFLVFFFLQVFGGFSCTVYIYTWSVWPVLNLILLCSVSVPLPYTGFAKPWAFFSCCQRSFS